MYLISVESTFVANVYKIKGNIAYLAEDIIGISMKRSFYIILLLCFVTGCGIRDVRNQLNDVESYIAERPDSALAVIESIDTTALKTNSLKAHHALLHAMALDKNYIDVKDDSLALTAVKYYQKHGQKKYLARSRYYLALSYYYNRQYDKSIIELSKAELVATKYDSLYWGFVKVLQADIHSIDYNGIDELEALEYALNIYTSINQGYYINNTKYRLAASYLNNRQYDKAQTLLDELINSNNLDQRILNKAIKEYAFLMSTRPDANHLLASCNYEKVAIGESCKYMSLQDYWAWAYSLSKIGEAKKSQGLVEDLKQIDSSGTAFYFMYLIAKHERRYGEAFECLEKFTEQNNNEVVQILKQSVSTIQRDYYQSQYEISNYKAKNRLLITIFILVGAIITILFTVLLVIRYKKKKESEKEEYIRYAEEVNRQLRELQKDSYTSLQKKYVLMYKSKYETLRALYERYMISNGRTDADKIMYREVTRLIDELRRDIKDSKTLERILDNDLDGILTTLRNEIPDLTKKDHILIGYLSIGFDVVMISHFMDCSPNSIYIRKSRLKKAIEDSGAEHKDVFLEIIG